MVVFVFFVDSIILENIYVFNPRAMRLQCEVEVGGDYYYIGPQRAGPPDRYES